MIPMKKPLPIALLLMLSLMASKGLAYSADSLNVYPNPFQDTLTIKFNLSQADTVSLNIYNVMGQSVKAFYQNTYLQSGLYTVLFIADTFPSGLYFVRLGLKNNTGISKKAIKEAHASIEKFDRENKTILLSPNPTKDLINIPLNGLKWISITNQSGQIVKSITTSATSISLADLSVGQYYITICTETPAFMTTKKIIKLE